MGGYGAGRKKGKCYYDTGGHKVTDKNAIAVAEQYIKEGKYVVFLEEEPPNHRADLLVDGRLVEVKGISSMNSSKVQNVIKRAFTQIEESKEKYANKSGESNKVVLLLKHSDPSDGLRIITDGFNKAVRAGYVTGKVEIWYNGKIVKLN